MRVHGRTMSCKEGASYLPFTKESFCMHREKNLMMVRLLRFASIQKLRDDDDAGFRPVSPLLQANHIQGRTGPIILRDGIWAKGDPYQLLARP